MFFPESDHKEGWVPKNWCFQTVVLEKTLESPFNNKVIKPVNPNGNQLTRGTDAEAEALILWPPDVKSKLIGKDPDTGKDWRQEVKGVTENEMIAWHHLTKSMDMSLSKVGEIVKDREAWRAAWSQSRTWLSNRTTTAKTSNRLSKENNCRALFQWWMVVLLALGVFFFFFFFAVGYFSFSL